MVAENRVSVLMVVDFLRNLQYYYKVFSIHDISHRSLPSHANDVRDEITTHENPARRKHRLTKNRGKENLLE